MAVNSVNSLQGAEDAGLSLPMFAGIVITIALVSWAMYYFHVVVRRIEDGMAPPNLKEYTFATALYPDALIIKFGVEQKFGSLSSRIKFTNVAWARMRWHLEKSLVDVIYANRRTAGNAISANPDIIASQRSLCVYHGFAICLKRSVLEEDPEGDLAVTKLAACLKGKPPPKILVHADTDQYRALGQLLAKIILEAARRPDKGKAAELANQHIEVVPPDSDLLERMWEADPLDDTQPPRLAANDAPIIGFAGGLTERVIAKRAGYGVVVPDVVTRPEYSEINSFVYASPPDGNDDLADALGEVEQLWDDTVTKILNQPQTQRLFQEFLNSQIRTQLGPSTLARLNGDPVFSQADMVEFLSEWVEFPRHGRPIVVAVADSSSA